MSERPVTNSEQQSLSAFPCLKQSLWLQLHAMPWTQRLLLHLRLHTFNINWSMYMGSDPERTWSCLEFSRVYKLYSLDPRLTIHPDMYSMCHSTAVTVACKHHIMQNLQMTLRIAVGSGAWRARAAADVLGAPMHCIMMINGIVLCILVRSPALQLAAAQIQADVSSQH